MPILHSIFEKIGLEPADLAGATVTSEIPLSEAALNRLLARQLAGHPHVASVRVTVRAGDELLVRVEPRLRLLPGVNVVVQIAGQPELPDFPVIPLRWHIPGTGPVTMLAGRVLAFLKAAPAGIEVNGDLVYVDLAVLLRSRGADDVLALVRRLAIHTRPGAVVVGVELTM